MQYNFVPSEINACKLNLLSNVLYPFLNPIWDSEIKPTSSNNSHNLSFRTAVNVLPRHDTNDMGIYDLGSLVSPLFLKIGNTTPSDHDFGIIHEFSTLSKSLQ